jgi:hypothetical protein
MGAGEQHDEAAAAGADNVIRFPRNWFGSVDDLVPIGARTGEDRAPADEDRAPADGSGVVCADDFWGQGAGALHQAIQATPELPAVPVTPRPDAARPDSASVEARSGLGDLLSRAWTHPTRRWTARPSAGVWWFAGMLGALAIVLLSVGGGAPLAHARADARLARGARSTSPPFRREPRVGSALASASVRLAGDESPARRGLTESVMVRGDRGIGSSGSHERRARGSLRPSRSAHGPGQHRSRSGHTATGRAGSVSRGQRTRGGGAGARSTSGQDAGGQVSQTGGTQAASGETASPASAGTAPTDNADATSATASAPAGPLTAGTAGSNCDPQCE